MRSIGVPLFLLVLTSCSSHTVVRDGAVYPPERSQGVLARYGITDAWEDEQLRAALPRVYEAEDDELREFLLVTGANRIGSRVVPSGTAPPPPPRRWDLPEPFGARLLAIVRARTRPIASLGVLSDDDLVASMALDLLERMQYVPALEDLMRPDHPLLDVARWAWPLFGRAAVPRLAARARENRKDRHWAIKGLGLIRDPDATPDLQALLDDPDEGIRTAATEALREMGAPMDLARFRRVLLDPQSRYRERKEAVATLGKLGGPTDLDFLLDYARRLLEARARSHAELSVVPDAVCEVVSRGHEAGIEWTRALLRRKDLDKEAETEIRIGVIRTLRGRGCDAPERLLLEVLEDDAQDLYARETACFSLGSLDAACYGRYQRIFRRASEGFIARSVLAPSARSQGTAVLTEVLRRWNGEDLVAQAIAVVELREGGVPVEVDLAPFRAAAMDVHAPGGRRQNAMAILCRLGASKELSSMLDRARSIADIAAPRGDDASGWLSDSFRPLLESGSVEALTWVLEFVRRAADDRETRFLQVKAIDELGLQEAKGAIETLTVVLEDPSMGPFRRQAAAKALAGIDRARHWELHQRHGKLHEEWRNSPEW